MSLKRMNIINYLKKNININTTDTICVVKKKTDNNTKTEEIEKKITTDHDHGKYLFLKNLLN